MIGKRAMGRASSSSVEAQVRALAAYIDREGDDLDRGEILLRGATGLVSIDRFAQIAEMAATAMGALRARSPIEHIILSWREGEYPCSREIVQCVSYLLHEAGLVGHQAIWTLHKARNVHLHVVVNRVAPDADRPTKVAFWHNAIGRAIARIEHAQGWTRELGARFEIIGETDVRQVFHNPATATGFDRNGSLRSRRSAQGHDKDSAAHDRGDGSSGSTGGDHRHDRDHEQEARRRLGEAARDTQKARIVRLIAAIRLRSAHMALPAGAILAQEIAHPDALSANAAEVEIRQGVMSAERIAIEIAGPIVERSRSWLELHELLAVEGIEYRQKGSGAILVIGENVVKASTYRKAALAALVKRFGPYEASSIPIDKRPRQAAPGVTPELFEALEAARANLVETNARAAELTTPLVFAPRLAKIVGGAVNTTIDLERLAFEIGAPPPTLSPLKRQPPPPHDPASALGRYHASVDADAYRLIFLKEPKRAGNQKTFVVPFSKIDDVALHWPIVESMQHDGAQIRIEPRSELTHHVIVSGLTDSSLQRLTLDGYAPALVTETASGVFDALLNAPTTAFSHEDRAAALASRDLNLKYGQTEGRNVPTGQRLPGTGNFDARNASSRGAHIVRIVKSYVGRVCAKLRNLIAAHQQTIKQTIANRRTTPDDIAAKSDSPVTIATRLYAVHLNEILASGKRPFNLSHIDLEIAQRLRATGHDAHFVQRAIERCAPALDPARWHNWPYYTSRLIEFVFSERASKIITQLAPFVVGWKQMETEAVAPPSKAQPLAREVTALASQPVSSDVANAHSRPRAKPKRRVVERSGRGR